MKARTYTELIPQNQSGKEINSEASVDCATEEEARSFYKKAAQKLLDVTNWHHTAGMLSAQFHLVDDKGQEVSRSVREGDYFKVDIPGPGSEAGEGYDWVQVEEMKEIVEPHVESIGFRVRPCTNPLTQDAVVAHFYSNESTSSFIVTRENNTIIAGVYDRNTQPNDEAKSITDQIRHTAIGMGAISSFSKLQWQNLAEGLLRKD